MIRSTQMRGIESAQAYGLLIPINEACIGSSSVWSFAEDKFPETMKIVYDLASSGLLEQTRCFWLDVTIGDSHTRNSYFKRLFFPIVSNDVDVHVAKFSTVLNSFAKMGKLLQTTKTYDIAVPLYVLKNAIGDSDCLKSVLNLVNTWPSFVDIYE